MESCPTCHDLVPLPGPSGGFVAGGEGIDLATSASNCQICSILWEGLSTFCDYDPEGVQWMALKQEGDAFRLQYRRSAQPVWLGLHFYTRNRESLLSDIFQPSIDIEPDTGCEKYLAQAKRWVHECCEKHENCKDRLSAALPTRVLDVARQDNCVFLCETDKAQSGSSHPNKKTLGCFKDGIHLDSLPQTFRDAVFMTRVLGCRYLWIDSLCIIQDSTEDWKLESTRMAKAYGNARVTIAAVASENSNGGLFSRHKASAAKHTIRRASNSGGELIVDARPALEHTAYHESNPYNLPPATEAKLLWRAWCFQEYLLSPRVMLFTDWEILWVCLTRLRCNCGHYSEDTRDLISESALKVRFDSILPRGSVPELSRLWMDVVSPYSTKELTYAADKLPAIAGIASLFAEKSLGLYVNGLWTETFLDNLFWEVDWILVNTKHIVVRRLGGSPPIPSWSWASITGPIVQGARSNDGDLPMGLELVTLEPKITGSLTDISTKPLILHGILIEVRIWGGQQNHQAYIDHNRRLSADDIPEQWWFLDVGTELVCSSETPMKAYILCGTSGPGLVVISVQRSGKDPSTLFKRLGR
ncbi:heterokaryon incompatibility protein-domain-containing protein [Xylaria arbuscula]|nr:heterokaryon incompatibility protein-domain-containing protein [Xylaria arbuscula]